MEHKDALGRKEQLGLLIWYPCRQWSRLSLLLTAGSQTSCDFAIPTCLLRGADFQFHQAPLLPRSAICRKVTLLSWLGSIFLMASHPFPLNVVDVRKAERGWAGPSGGGDSRGG